MYILILYYANYYELFSKILMILDIELINYKLIGLILFNFEIFFLFLSKNDQVISLILYITMRKRRNLETYSTIIDYRLYAMI